MKTERSVGWDRYQVCQKITLELTEVEVNALRWFQEIYGKNGVPIPTMVQGIFRIALQHPDAIGNLINGAVRHCRHEEMDQQTYLVGCIDAVPEYQRGKVASAAAKTAVVAG